MTLHNKPGYKITDWITSIDTCPHCNGKLNIKSQSKKSKQVAITGVFMLLLNHIKSECSMGLISKSPQKTSVKITIRFQSLEEDFFGSTYENDKILI